MRACTRAAAAHAPNTLTMETNPPLAPPGEALEGGAAAAGGPFGAPESPRPGAGASPEAAPLRDVSGRATLQPATPSAVEPAAAKGGDAVEGPGQREEEARSRDSEGSPSEGAPSDAQSREPAAVELTQPPESTTAAAPTRPAADQASPCDAMTAAQEAPPPSRGGRYALCSPSPDLGADSGPGQDAPSQPQSARAAVHHDRGAGGEGDAVASKNPPAPVCVPTLDEPHGRRCRPISARPGPQALLLPTVCLLTHSHAHEARTSMTLAHAALSDEAL